MSDRLLKWSEVKQKGITYHRNTRDRLIKEGKFPRPVRGASKQLAWVEREIDEHIEKLIAARDTPKQQTEVAARSARAATAGRIGAGRRWKDSARRESVSAPEAAA